MSASRIHKATTGVVAVARPETMRARGADLTAVRAFRSPSPTFADVVGAATATQDPNSVSGKQLWSLPPV
jgi:hypothetical protein